MDSALPIRYHGPAESFPAHPLEAGRVRVSMSRVVFRDARYRITAQDVVDLLLDADLEVWAGGGTARDWIAGQEPRDLDLFVDQPVDVFHKALRRGFPGIDPFRRPRPHGHVLIWGGGEPGEIELAMVRSYRDIQARDAFTTHFPPGRDLREHLALMDFTINALLYEFRRGLIVDPLGIGLDDVFARRLRIVSHPEVLESVYVTSLRIVQFLCRGYRPVPETFAFLESHADRDVVGMGERLPRWLANHWGHDSAAEAAAMARELRRWLQTEKARQRLDRATAELGWREEAS